MVLKENIPKKTLHELYINRGYSICMIARKFKMSDTPIKRMLNEYQIPRRDKHFFTQEIRKNISKGAIKRFKNNRHPLCGKSPSKTTIEKIKKTLKSKHQEGKIKIWNKGLVKETDKRVRKYVEKSAKTQKGRPKPKLSETRKRLFKEGKLMFTEAHLKKISEALKGKPNPKLSLKLKGRHTSPRTEFKPGVAHRHWRGGISFEPYGLEFNSKLKEFIRKRDNYTCQECGFTQEQLGYKLSVHHIDFNKKNNNPNNLISLCRNCHLQTNFNREDWIQYFQSKIIR